MSGTPTDPSGTFCTRPVNGSLGGDGTGRGLGPKGPRPGRGVDSAYPWRGKDLLIGFRLLTRTSVPSLDDHRVPSTGPDRYRPDDWGVRVRCPRRGFYSSLGRAREKDCSSGGISWIYKNAPRVYCTKFWASVPPHRRAKR